MTDNHPITPSPELVQEWWEEARRDKRSTKAYFDHVATNAARWGSDQELLACGNYLEKCASWEPEDVTEFYNYRRPKPPSLKEQALAAQQRMWDGTSNHDDWNLIRRALEALDD